MRITNRMMADAAAQDIARQKARLFDAQETVSSGKRINRPSDDPIGTGRIASYRDQLTTFDGYVTAVRRAGTRLEVMESTLDTMADLLGVASNFIRNAGTANGADRIAAAEEIAQIREQVRSFANTRLEDDYLFAGHQVRGASPVAPDGTYQGDDGEIRTPAGPDRTIAVNATGFDLFLTDADNKVAVLGVLDQAVADLLAGTDPDPTAAGQVDAARERLDAVRARGASRRYRLNAFRESLETIAPQFEAIVADLENADIERAIVELRVQETAYETSLQTAARVIPPKLLDFLR